MSNLHHYCMGTGRCKLGSLQGGGDSGGGGGGGARDFGAHFGKFMHNTDVSREELDRWQGSGLDII